MFLENRNTDVISEPSGSKDKGVDMKRSHATYGRLCLLMLVVQLLAFSQPVAARSAKARYQVLYVFRGGADGGGPGALVLDETGILYGTTTSGGAFGHGTVFKLDKTGKHTVLYSFKGGSDGDTPNSTRLARDAGANLYGTTQNGGSSGPCVIGDGGCGIVFKVDRTGKETVLYRFTGGSDGSQPLNAGVIRDVLGNLFGTTAYGGQGGNVFKLDKHRNETVVYDFLGGSDGDLPMASLVQDEAGNLYGTTYVGGSTCGGNGCGIVFKVDRAGTETILHRFTGGFDGGYPDAELVRDSAGNLYGVATAGGNGGAGTVFKVNPSGEVTSLHDFTDAQGAPTYSGLVLDKGGNLYGTTSFGGDLNCPPPFGGGCGTVFKLSASGKYTVLHVFEDDGKGEAPESTLARDAAGNLYGIAGTVVFKLIP